MDISTVNKYLSNRNDKYNIKTVQLPEFKIKMMKRSIFTRYKELEFLPVEFTNFIELFIDNPDPFITIYDYDKYIVQYYQNCLLDPWYDRYYKLFTRYIYHKTDRFSIDFVYIVKKNGDYSFNVYKNFKRTVDGPISANLTFLEALNIFYTTNL